MKTIAKSLIFAIALTFSVSAFAGTLSDYPVVRDAVNNDNLTLYSYWACLDEGYELSETKVQPIYYQIPPQGEHQSHTVTITMVKRSGGNNSLTTKYVTIEVQIIDDSNGNVTCKDMNVTRQTVY